MVERPQWSAVHAQLTELRQSLGRIEQAQKEVLAVTGTAWSDDGFVKAVVGPRGHLVELEIDPRVYRNPNSKALAATIVAVVKTAVEQVMAQTQEVLSENLPKGLRLGKAGQLDLNKLMTTNDADLRVEEGDDV